MTEPDETVIESIRLSLEQGADGLQQAVRGVSLLGVEAHCGALMLMVAAWPGDHEKLQLQLLHQGCNPYLRDSHGRGILHLAGRAGNARIVGSMLPLLDVNEQDSSGMTALHHASEGRHVRSAFELLTAGAAQGVLDAQGMTWAQRGAADFIGHMEVLMEASAMLTLLKVDDCDFGGAF